MVLLARKKLKKSNNKKGEIGKRKSGYGPVITMVTIKEPDPSLSRR